MADEESVRTRHKDGILTVTINRPHRKNAVDGATWDGLREAFRNAGADPGVRVLVLTGAGGDFCAGADLSSDREQQHPLHRMRAVNEVAQLLHQLPMPDQGTVEREQRPDSDRGAGRRGPDPVGQLRHRGHRGCVPGLQGQDGGVLHR
jgi:hypothetical protein